MFLTLPTLAAPKRPLSACIRFRAFPLGALLLFKSPPFREKKVRLVGKPSAERQFLLGAHLMRVCVGQEYPLYVPEVQERQN